MKKKLFLSVMTLMGVISLSSCQNDVTAPTEENEQTWNDSIVLNLKYMNPAQILGLSTTRVSEVPYGDVEEGADGLTIVSFYWGKRSPYYTKNNRDCVRRTAHLCYALWFPMPEPIIYDSEFQDDQVYSVLERDEKGQYYANILLAEEPTFSEAITPFISVDEDATFWGTRSLNSVEFTTVQGQYLYDRSLGLYGGFKIDIEVNE